jgi:hypothetical protein
MKTIEKKIIYTTTVYMIYFVQGENNQLKECIQTTSSRNEDRDKSIFDALYRAYKENPSIIYIKDVRIRDNEGNDIEITSDIRYNIGVLDKRIKALIEQKKQREKIIGKAV